MRRERKENTAGGRGNAAAPGFTVGELTEWRWRSCLVEGDQFEERSQYPCLGLRMENFEEEKRGSFSYDSPACLGGKGKGGK